MWGVRHHTNRPVSELRCSGFLCKSGLARVGGPEGGRAARRAGGQEPASNLERRESNSVVV